MKWHIVLALMSLLLVPGCDKEKFDDSAYVLIRTNIVNNSIPSLRAYFVGESAQLNGISCRELLQLANEAVEARIARGETHL